MKVLIVASGTLINEKIFLDEYSSSDIVICADGGAKFAHKYGIVPHYLIGDFDSIDYDILEYFSSKNTVVIKYPREKDFTDTEICINKALELGATEICIIAGIGGRIDHSLGNIGLLHIINEQNVKGYITADDCSIYVCNSEISIKGNVGDTISIIPYKGDVSGVNLRGLKYPLVDADIKFGRPIGISNEMIDDHCTVIVENGELLVIKQNIN